MPTATTRPGRHRRRRRRMPLPAAAGTAAVTAALLGSSGLVTAGASESSLSGTLVLDSPARPAAASTTTGDEAFADLTSASSALASRTTQASSASHQEIRVQEIEAKRERERKERERKRQQAAERAAREKAERERLASMYTKPLGTYRVSAQYGVQGWMWARGYHTGLDLTAPYGTPVKAVHTGRVTSAGWDGAYGYKVEITHPDGTTSWYAHMSSITVSSGSVSTGQTIGHVGSTGNSYGNHLHLEVHAPGGGELNPYTWLQNNGVRL